MKLIPTVIVSALALGATSAAMAQGCCGAKGDSVHATCTRDAALAATKARQDATVRPVFAEPVQRIFDDYIKIQTALAQDSLEGIPAAGSAMAKAIRADQGKNFPEDLAAHCEALAKAVSLESARAAFKSVSGSLVVYTRSQKAAVGPYHVAYCPMAKASWVQTGKAIVNPYMGKSMVACGQFKS